MAESPEEREHWRSVIRAFDGYMRYHLSANHARRMAFLSMPKESKRMFDMIGYRDKLDAVDEGIRRNAEFIEEMIATPVFADMMEPDTDDDEESDPQRPVIESPASDKTIGPHTHSHPHSHAHTHSQTPDHAHSHIQSSTPQQQPVVDSKRLQAEADMVQDKIRSTLRSFVRDWADVGQAERDACYAPCLEALEKYFPSQEEEGEDDESVAAVLGEAEKERKATRKRGDVRVLVPGCGLGRLAMEIAAKGFASQGNEFSTYMLIASHWVLNQTTHRHSHSIYPYLHSFSNHFSTLHNLMLRVQIPDVCPADVLGQGQGGDFSLVAGDFEEIYGPSSWDVSQPSENMLGLEGDGKVEQRGRWGAVVTCFFIDCARNVLNYLQIIHTILEEDGVWINIGPLLWHFENSPTTSATGEGSIELSLDEVKELARKVGFEFHLTYVGKKETRIIPTTYTGIPGGMLRHEYQAAFWVATKIKSSHTADE